jgi:hypothetical protein
MNHPPPRTRTPRRSAVGPHRRPTIPPPPTAARRSDRWLFRKHRHLCPRTLRRRDPPSTLLNGARTKTVGGATPFRSRSFRASNCQRRRHHCRRRRRRPSRPFLIGSSAPSYRLLGERRGQGAGGRRGIAALFCHVSCHIMPYYQLGISIANPWPPRVSDRYTLLIIWWVISDKMLVCVCVCVLVSG